jgi:galactose mutarotase-like enzyme
MAAGTRLPLSVEREVRVVAQPERLLVRTTVTNSADCPVRFIWGEHPAFAVSEGDEIDLPPSQVFASDGAALGEWPLVSDGRRLDRVENSRPDESVHYLTGLREGWAAIRRQDHGLALAWNVEEFPYAWLWREVGSPGFPFFGRASLVAVEPAASWPGDGLSGAIERGQAIRLQPHERRSTVVALIPFELRGRAVAGASVSGQICWAPS